MATNTQDRFEARLTAIEVVVGQLEKRLESLERQISDLREEIRSINGRVDAINGRLLWMWATLILAILGAHYLK